MARYKIASEEEKTQMRIEELTFDFSKRIIGLYQYLTREADEKEYIISKQLLRSGTSIGANVAESQHPQSDADYLTKMYIALKEARESEYWLKLLSECEIITKEQSKSLLADCSRINRILITIVNKVENRITKKQS